MENDYLPVNVHNEFVKRVEEENHRQNERLTNIEQAVKQVQSITTSVEKLAVNMEGMLNEQEKQGKRLEALEKQDGELWRRVVGYVITAILGIVIGFIFKQIGM